MLSLQYPHRNRKHVRPEKFTTIKHRHDGLSYPKRVPFHDADYANCNKVLFHSDLQHTCIRPRCISSSPCIFFCQTALISAESVAHPISELSDIRTARRDCKEILMTVIRNPLLILERACNFLPKVRNELKSSSDTF